MMRGRIVLFIVLAVAVALAGVYVGLSANTPKAVGEPGTSTAADSSVGSVQRRPSGSGSLRSPAASSQQGGHETGSPTAAGNPGGTATQPGHQPATEPAPKPPPSPGPVRFGKVTTTPSAGVVTSVALSDRRALTTTFDDMSAGSGVGNEEVTSPYASRSFSMTLPITGGAKGEALKVYVQGMAVTTTGTSARLTLKLNGQVKARDFPAGWEDSFIEWLEVPAIPATTYQLQGVLEVDQDPGSERYAGMNVLSVDASISR
jgi:hypothetical protein